MDTRCCKEEDDEEEEALAALERGQPSVLGAERGRELLGHWCPPVWWEALG